MSMNKIKENFENTSFGVAALLAIGGIAGFLTIAATQIIVSGIVITVLWSWFVTPLFGLPALSIPYAIGLSLITHYMTFQYTGDESEDKAKYWLTMFLRPCLTIIVGYIVKVFI